MNKKNIVGILWMIVHVICASVLSSYARMLYKSFHPFYISLFFNFSAFLIALPLIIVNRKQLIKSCFISLHALRGALYTFAQLIFVFVYNHMHYAQVVSITISYPLFTTIFAVVFLKERIGVHRIVALVIGFAGALVVVNPAAEEFNN